jgi:hypothetical protein
MAISDDLFRSILSMDNHNRGYAQGIAGLGGVCTENLIGVDAVMEGDTRRAEASADRRRRALLALQQNIRTRTGQCHCRTTSSPSSPRPA